MKEAIEKITPKKEEIIRKIKTKKTAHSPLLYLLWSHLQYKTYSELTSCVRMRFGLLFLLW